jgi:hypothetical protein
MTDRPLEERLASVATPRLVEMLGALARKRTRPTIGEIELTRALIAGLRTRKPEAFAAVDGLDRGSPQYLRQLTKALEPDNVTQRRTPAKDDAALCEAHPRCEPITLDGTGLSGARCGYHVVRLRPLLPGRPELGKTKVHEPCGKVGVWSLPSESDDLSLPDRLVFCTTHAADVLRARTARKPERADRSIVGADSRITKQTLLSGDEAAPSVLAREPAAGERIAHAPDQTVMPADAGKGQASPVPRGSRPGPEGDRSTTTTRVPCADRAQERDRKLRPVQLVLDLEPPGPAVVATQSDLDEARRVAARGVTGSRPSGEVTRGSDVTHARTEAHGIDF